MATLDLQCQDTIAALLTGSGDGVVSVVRVSGPQALDVRDRVFRKRRPGPFRPATLHLGEFQLGPGSRAEGLCVTFPGAASYTGEPCVEFHGYGGRIHSARLLTAVLSSGARQALPGEFTLRAYLHGKMALDQAEAVCALMTARSDQAALAAERLSGGALGRALEPLREGLLLMLAETEAYLDFPDDGLPEKRLEAQRMLALEVADSLLGLLRGHDRTRRMLEGARVVLWGAPNAGKSSLLNALCGEERAIVDEVPGTTRDVVETQVQWDGMPVTLVDTAGVRTAEGKVEQEGVRRSHAEAARADLVLYCVSTANQRGELTDPPTKNPPFIVETKGDLASSWGAAPVVARRLGTEFLTVSAHTGLGMTALRTRIMLRLGGKSGVADSVTATARQGDLLQAAAHALKEAVRSRDDGQPEEVVAEWMRQATRQVGEVSGRAVPNEEVLGAIFSRFCIGK